MKGNQLAELGFKPVPKDGSYDNHQFKVRLLTMVDRGKVLQIAVKKCFDRWANSVNFEIEMQYSFDHHLNLAAAFKHARTIVKSGVFDFNRYFHVIGLDPSRPWKS